MSWSLTKALHLDVYGQYPRVLMVSAIDSALLQPPPDFIQGDAFPIRLYFWERGDNGSLIAADPGSSASIIFSARPAGVPTGSALLFECNAFTQTSPGIWDGTCSLATAEISALLAADPSGTKTILAEVEVRDSITNTKRTSLQFDLTLRPEVYANDDTPAALPTPEDWLATRRPLPILRSTGDGAPITAATATLTVDPTGTNNSVLFTAAHDGAAYNAISIAYAAPALQAGTSIALVGSAFTITPSTKDQMVISAITTPTSANRTLLYAGIDPVSGSKIWTHDGNQSTVFPAGGAMLYCTGGVWWYLSRSAGSLITDYQATKTSAATWPDTLTAWTVTMGGVGSPTVTAATTTAAQLIAAVNASTAFTNGTVIASAVGTVTGIVAAVSSANLAGGITGTPGSVGQECYVNLSTVHKCVQTTPVKWVALN